MTSLQSLTALIPQFIEQLDEWDLWDRNPTEAFERQAAQFYAETGLMAPGKSVPLAMSSVGHDVERQARYKAWETERRTKRRQMMRALANELATLVPSPPTPEPEKALDDKIIDLGVRYGDGDLSDDQFVAAIKALGTAPADAPNEEGPFFRRDLGRILGIPDELASMDAIHHAVSALREQIVTLEKAYEEQVALYKEARDLCNLNFDKRMEAETALRAHGQHRPECKSKKARTTRNHDGSNTTRWPYECDCGFINI